MSLPVSQKGDESSDFVFSTYFLALRDAWSGRISNSNLVTQLYDFISYPLELRNRKGEAIVCSPSEATRLKNRKSNAHSQIVEHCQALKNDNTIVSDFELFIIPNLQQSKIDQLIDTLLQSILASKCSESIKDDFRSLAEDKLIAKFLSNALCESLSWPNKLPVGTNLPQKKSSGFPKFNGAIRPDVPDKFVVEEMPYIHALIRVYAEVEGDELFSAKDIEKHSDYKAHLQQQRKSYFSAEFIRRCMRDTYASAGEDQFEILEEEIYDGIIDVHGRDYDYGKQRLSEVLSQATLINLDGCWIHRDTDWIRISVKKGICHFLINDEKLKGWLDEDRQSF